jgi:glycoside/pentoside/hexuronide:cation symporter, GPH family
VDPHSASAKRAVSRSDDVTTAVPALAPRLPATTLLAYGVFGMPLAMAALPLYVHLPKFYGDYLGIDLALLGGVLLALRLADGVIDPLLGVLSDRGGARKRWLAFAAPPLALGMVGLFLPQPRGQTGLVVWLAATLAIVYLAFSLATINHNAWGAELSADPVERTRVTAMREGLALCAVIIAAVLPGFLGGGDGGLGRFAILYAGFTLVCVTITLAGTPAGAQPVVAHGAHARLRDLIARPLADRLFRKLLVVFMLNGIAAAIPATLVLFFIADVLDAESRQGTFLALYFVAGAGGMPVWVRLSARFGKPQAWLVAMGVAIAAFVWASRLGAGDTSAFAVICVLSGLALGADLALPPSLLADVIGRRGRMEGTGSYFGLWTLATKLNLALAAGIALPLLEALGYKPGGRDPAALNALAIVYAFVPCVLKLGAGGALLWFRKSQ